MSSNSPLPDVSRRAFLAGCGATGVAVASPLGTASGAERESRSWSSSASIDSPERAGRISLEGLHSIAETNRRFQQAQAQMDRTVRAVEDLGLDPTGETAINGDFGQIDGLSNARITFPSDGTFLLNEQITVRPDGPVEIMGNGCSFIIPPNSNMKSFIFVLPSGSLIRDITIDQTAEGALQGLSIQSRGTIRVENLTIKGYAPATVSTEDDPFGSTFTPIALTQSAMVQVVNLKEVGGTAAGLHDEGDLPPDARENRLGSPSGIFIGKSNLGTVQLVEPKISGWSNGIYGGRTPGNVEVRGGDFLNNFNSQTRISGGSIVDGASMLLNDTMWTRPGQFDIGHQGVYAARIDGKNHGNLTAPTTFKNVRVVAESMREGASLFDWESASGPGIVENCHITNHLDREVFLGENPNAPAATNVLVNNCLIDGSSQAEVMVMNNRGQSRIKNTCVKLPNAGPGDVEGAIVGSNMTWGSECTGKSGLRAPDKLGVPSNISSGNFTSNYSVASFRRQGDRKSIIDKLVGIFTSIVTSLAMIVLSIIAIAIGLVLVVGIAMYKLLR